jgi:DNA-binding transcriptional ArsR family regulator
MARTPTTYDAFNAIAEPKRRELLDLLGNQELSVNAIVERLGWSQPMVSKHL